MSSNPREHHVDNHIRQTGKFKPINITSHGPKKSETMKTFEIGPLNNVETISAIKSEHKNQYESRWWRLYFEQTISTYSKSFLSKAVENCLKIMSANNQLQQHKNSQIFININGILIERMRGIGDLYYTSNLDYNCLLVTLRTNSKSNQLTKTDYKVECFHIDTSLGVKSQKDFVQQIYIKLKQQNSLFYLIYKGIKMYIVKDKNKDLPKFELSQQYLQETVTDICKNSLLIKNLSPRIISIKFLEQQIPQNNQPLQINIPNSDAYQFVLFKINRLKYGKYKIEEPEGKEWHSFDQKLTFDHKKQNKTTPEKAKKTGKPVQNLTINKKTNDSTNFVEEDNEDFDDKKNNRGNMLNQPKHLKISQNVVTNPKESNLVASQLEYPSSLKDQNEKQGQYIEDFENLLFEEEGAEEKQLSLNDSFEQFQKKDNNPKAKQILEELNKRKQKEKEQKLLTTSLKQTISELVQKEKEMIDKNLKLRVQIKKIQRGQYSEGSDHQLKDQTRLKIKELRKYQRKLLEELVNIKSENNIEVLVFGQPKSQPRSSQSQRSSQKMAFHSINAFPTLKNMELTSSIRSDKGEGKIRSGPSVLTPQSSLKRLDNPTNMSPSSIKFSQFPQGGHQNFPVEKTKEKPLNLYSSVPATQSFIHPMNNKNINSGYVTSNNLMGLNSSGSSKNLPESPPEFSTCHLKSQNSQKKLSIPYSPIKK